MNDPVVPVVMCTWKRINNLPRTLASLKRQQGVKSHLYIWNNNPSIKDQIDEIIAAADQKVSVIHSPENVGGFGRFYMARQLADEYKYIVFIDDDQELQDNSIATLWSEAKPKTISSWWAYNFLSRKSYWLRLSASKGKRATYVGTCGMVSDSSIFKDEELFNCPKEFWFIEDLWLSYYAEHIHHWKLYKSETELRFIPDTKNQFMGLMADKTRFLRHLASRGWVVPIFKKRRQLLTLRLGH